MKDVFIAVGIVFAVALVLGVALCVLDRFFSIPEDERKKKARACLPGINCGACGYKGCDDYAAALAAGKAAPNLCIPGGEEVAASVAAVLGVENTAKPLDMVAFVHCNGVCDAVAKKTVYNGVNTCRAASMLYGGPSACHYGCLGCGDCAAACPMDAICLEDGIARVDTRRCVGCGMCVKTCPKGIISMIPQETQVANYCSNKDKGAVARKTCKNACIGCMKCEKVCPSGAIKVVENLATVDAKKCTGCGACAAGCPTGCLKMVYFPDLVEE